MDTSETYIKMADCPEIQTALWEYEGYLSPPDDGAYHRNEPYAVAVIYDHRVECPNCGNWLKTKFCPTDGGVAAPFLSRHISFGGPCSDSIKNDKIIWLPRQDQLQEMLYTPQPVGYGYDLCNSIAMNEWATCYSEHYKSTVYTEYALTFKSLEQLWLAFVMKEKYGKTWNGSEWE